ncbi:MAG: hypothetical protein WA051_00855 [Minisyncoccia bacterium]
MKLPLWFRLPFFFDSLLALSFWLKYICPIDYGCFTDPLVKFFFAPLFFIEDRKWLNFTPASEIIFLLLTWFLFGLILGIMIEAFTKKD